MIVIYTDGSCRGNGKSNSSGGYGVVVTDGENNLINAYQHQEDNTTNNAQELKAILYAMLNYGKMPDVVVCSDSAYCVNTLTNWMYNWANNNWLKGDGRPPENLELIQTYYELENKGFKIKLTKVPGHSGIKWNELADALATGKIYVKDLNKYGE